MTNHDVNSIRLSAFISHVVAVLLRRRLVFFFLGIALVSVLAMGLPQLKENNDFRIMFPADSKLVDDLEQVEQDFTRANDVVFVLGLKPGISGDLFQTSYLQELKQLTEQSERIPNTVRVDSLTNHLYINAQDDVLNVQELVGREFDFSPDSLRTIRDYSSTEPSLLNRLISEDSRVTAVRVSISLPREDRAALEADSAQRAREIAAEFTAQNPSWEIHLIGSVMRNYALAEVSAKDAGTLFPAMLVLIIVLAGLLFRSWVAVSVTLCVVLVTVLAQFSIVALIGWALSTTSMASPIIVLTISVATVIHLLSGYRIAFKQDADKLSAIRLAFERNFLAIFVTTLTTTVGFLSLNFSETQPFRDLGNFTAIGVLANYLICMLMLPFLLSILPPIAYSESSIKRLDNVIKRLLTVLDQWAKSVMVLLLLLTIAAVYWFQQNELTDTPIEYFDTSMEIRQAADYITDNLTGIETIQVSVDMPSNDADASSNVALLGHIETFHEWIQEKPEVRHVYSYVDTLKRLNLELNNGAEQRYRIPEDSQLAAQYKLIYDMSLPLGADINDLVSFNGDKLRFFITVDGMKSRRFIQLEQEIHDWFANNTPSLNVVTTGETLVFSHIGQKNIDDMKSGSLVTLALITLVMMIALRSWRFGVLSILPNVLPCLFMYGLWGLFVGQINMAAAMVFTITLGIVVDDTVHLLMKYLYYRREAGLAPRAALHQMFQQVLPAIVTTSIVIAIGFSVLMFSAFAANAILGKMVALVVVIALVVDVLLIPVFILLANKRPSTQTSSR